MKRLLGVGAALAVLLALAGIAPLSASSAGASPGDRSIYRALRGFEPTGAKKRVEPKRYDAVAVNLAAARSRLSQAPAAGSRSALTFSLPTPAGGFERFAVQQTSVMEAGLAAQHPEIRSWSGRSLDNPGTTVALDVTPMGMHASVRGPNGQGVWYLDPAYNRRGTVEHLAYDAASLPREASNPLEKQLPSLRQDIERQRAARVTAGTATVTQRVYRLALVSDPSYAAFFGSENVLAEKATLLNRVNQVYNDDLAIRLVLVDGTPALNFDTVEKATGSNGPCGTHACYTIDPEPTTYVEGQLAYCDSGTLNRTQTVLGQLIGAGSYDIGHIVLGKAGGGLAGLGVVGNTDKASGCTGVPTPTGDYFAVDYVAHEMGHQFSGNHTFNGTEWACSGGNRNGPTSVEPGSGSSVMAYAGICRQDNLQAHSDPYFSQRSIDEVTAYTTGQAPPLVEIQDVSLTGFDTDGDSITLDYPGAPVDPITLTRGGTGTTAYTTANIEKAVEALTGTDVTVAKWGYDPYSAIYDDVFPAPPGEADDTGFEVIFASDTDVYGAQSARRDMHALIARATGATAKVGETAQGGPAHNRGDARRTGNQAPVVTAAADRTIPLRTPFVLRGSGTDPDGDRLTYLWEQNDAGTDTGTTLTNNLKVEGPLFRVFSQAAAVTKDGSLQSPSPGENIAGLSPQRTLPDVPQILAGNTNAKTGMCPAAPSDQAAPLPPAVLDCYSEFLPTRAYGGPAGWAKAALHFRLTARDGAPGGGGVGHDDITLRIDRSAGPFLVQPFATSAPRGATRTVTWKVNNTAKLARNVKILLSVDNGKTWRYTLASSTPNDGSQAVRLPAVAAAKAWLRIDAVDNYFFDIGDAPFRIT